MKLPGGWWIGWAWTHCNGESSRTSALILSRHPSNSITWTFSLTVNRRAEQTKSWFAERWRLGSLRQWSVGTPLGGLSMHRQDFMERPTDEEQKQRDEELEAFYSPVPDCMPEDWR